MALELGMDPKTEPYNSALYWLPKIIGVSGLNVPRTLIVKVEANNVWNALEGTIDSDLEQKVANCAMSIGYPVFIRTDIGSAKHSGPKAYRADSEKDIGDVLFRLIESEMGEDLVGERFPSAILIREWIDIPAAFTAFGGVPIGREFRFFVFRTPNLACARVCHHYYWPEGAMRFNLRAENPPPADWRDRLASLSRGDEWMKLGSDAVAAVDALPDHPSWSVDFAQDAKGVWWLIDIAIAERSTHLGPCPNKLTKDEEGA